METSCRCASPSDWPSVSSHDLGPNPGAGLNFVKRKMAPDNEPKKVAKATQFNDARIYKLEYVGNFWWKRGKIFWTAAGSFCRSRISIVLNITRDILFWKVKLKLVEYVSISSNIIADVITKAALSSQLFKDAECWSGRGSNRRPPAQQTSALPTELPRQKLKLKALRA